jgi:ABC-2 type transport system permease protein
MTGARKKRTGIDLMTRQVLIVGYMLGVLWLRRYPSSIIFSAAMPFSLLFVVFVVSGGQNLPYAVAGGIVVAAVGYGLSLGSDLSWYRIDFRLQDFFVSSPASLFTYMSGMAVSLLMFGLPALGILTGILVFVSGSLLSIPYIIATVILTWGSMSALSFVISSHMPHTKNVEQMAAFMQIVLGVLPPVFYSIEILPLPLQYVAYALPTTHASLVLQHAAGIATPAGWTPVIGLAIMAGYLAVFGILAKTKAVWRED